MRYFFMILVLMVLFANFANLSLGGMDIEQVTGEVCSSDWVKIELDVNETLYLSSIHLVNDGFVFGSSYDEMFFFNSDNFLRFSEKYLEYFDKNPSFDNGSIIIKIMNISNSKDPLKSGYYNLSLSAVVQRRDDSFIEVPDITKTIEIKTPLNIVSAEVFDRKNRSNTIIMGEDISIRFKDIKTGLFSSNITGYVGYQDLITIDFSLNASNSSFQEFYNVSDTLFGDTIGTPVCPSADAVVMLNDICGETSIVYEQIAPNPSDIYFHVDRFFEKMKETDIPQIYYMVGAYFSCLREDARIYF